MPRNRSKKYLFITGGVSSSLGKGLASACVGTLLQRRGIKINLLKMDPYINVDPGTMNPLQHGEVYVTDDGAETDLDLGHYERFTELKLTRSSNFTTGQVYQKVIEDERQGVYLGKTVQVVPHITNEIKRRIHEAARPVDLLIGEIGGTVGDIESLPFLEAIRQFALDVGNENVLFIHLILLPYLKTSQELKTKPAQHSFKELRSIGLNPHIIICRSESDISDDLLDKISLFSNVSRSQVFKSLDVSSIYELPLHFHDQKMDQKIIELLGIWASEADIQDLYKIKESRENPQGQVTIGLVGKYTKLQESYKSLQEALVHGALSFQHELKIVYVDSRKDLSEKELEDLDGILVPGGFGSEGIEGKIKAINFARINNLPFLGICLGMQLALIEFFRNVLEIRDAHSEEFSQTGQLVIHYMEGQGPALSKGGSMRLGAYECKLVPSTQAHKIYGKQYILERHRHRFEINNHFLPHLEGSDLVVSGVNPDLNLVEIVELKNHPFFIGCQYHPEFKSSPTKGHPLFKSFISMAIERKKGRLTPL